MATNNNYNYDTHNYDYDYTHCKIYNYYYNCNHNHVHDHNYSETHPNRNLASNNYNDQHCNPTENDSCHEPCPYVFSHSRRDEPRADPDGNY